MNIEDNSGVAVRAFQIRVSERNRFNAVGGEAILDVNNPAPDMSTFSPGLATFFDGVLVVLSGHVPTDADFEKYEIYMDTNNPPTTLLATVDTNTKQITVNDLVPDTLYYVQVKPYDVFGPGIVSAVNSITSTDGLITNNIADFAVTNAKIANLAVDNSKIANLAVTNAKIAALAVTEAKIAALAVTSAKIDTLAVTNAKIGNLAVDTLQIAGSAVETDKVKDNAITVSVGSSTSGTIQTGTSYLPAESITITTQGGPVVVFGKAESWGTAPNTFNRYQLYDTTNATPIDELGHDNLGFLNSDGGRVNQGGSWTSGLTQVVSLLGVYTPPAGSNTIILRFKNSAGNYAHCKFRGISAFELKK